MIIHNNIKYYTYDETADKLHSTKNYLYILVSQGKLKSEKIGHSRKRYISEHEISEHLNTSSIGTGIDTLPIPTTQPFPIQSNSVALASDISRVYTELGKTITQSYSDTVQPLVKTAIDTDMENFFAVISDMLEKILNKVYAMSKEQFHSEMSPEQFLHYMMQDIDIPSEIKDALLASTIDAIRNAENALALKTKAS